MVFFLPRNLEQVIPFEEHILNIGSNHQLVVVRIYNQQFQISYSFGENDHGKVHTIFTCIFHGDLQGKGSTKIS